MVIFVPFHFPLQIGDAGSGTETNCSVYFLAEQITVNKNTGLYEQNSEHKHSFIHQVIFLALLTFDCSCRVVTIPGSLVTMCGQDPVVFHV